MRKKLWYSLGLLPVLFVVGPMSETKAELLDGIARQVAEHPVVAEPSAPASVKTAPSPVIEVAATDGETAVSVPVRIVADAVEAATQIGTEAAQTLNEIPLPTELPPPVQAVAEPVKRTVESAVAPVRQAVGQDLPAVDELEPTKIVPVEAAPLQVGQMPAAAPAETREKEDKPQTAVGDEPAKDSDGERQPKLAKPTSAGADHERKPNRADASPTSTPAAAQEPALRPAVTEPAATVPLPPIRKQDEGTFPSVALTPENAALSYAVSGPGPFAGGGSGAGAGAGFAGGIAGILTDEGFAVYAAVVPGWIQLIFMKDQYAQAPPLLPPRRSFFVPVAI